MTEAEKIFFTPIHFNSIEDIRAHKFFGNHAFDHQAFQAIHRFAADLSKSVAERAEAIRIKCARGMGMPVSTNESDEEVLKEALSY